MAPEYKIAFAVPAKVIAGTKTSSLFLIPQATKLKCKASVPLIIDITYFVFVYYFI